MSVVIARVVVEVRRIVFVDRVLGFVILGIVLGGVVRIVVQMFSRI